MTRYIIGDLFNFANKKVPLKEFKKTQLFREYSNLNPYNPLFLEEAYKLIYNRPDIRDLKLNYFEFGRTLLNELSYTKLRNYAYRTIPDRTSTPTTEIDKIMQFKTSSMDKDKLFFLRRMLTGYNLLKKIQKLEEKYPNRFETANDKNMSKKVA